MDGNTLEQLLTPESGQVSEPVVSDPAPAEPAAPGQATEPPAPAEPIGGQGEPTAPPEPEPEVVSMRQYKELQKGFTQKAMELAQIKKQLAQQPEVPQVQQVPQAQPGSLAEMINRAVQESVAGMVAPIQQQQQDLRIQAKVNELAENREFEDVAPAFLEMLDENPELLDNEKGLELAYKAAKADYYERALTARNQAQLQSSQQVTAQKVANTNTAPIVKATVAPDSPEAAAEEIRQSMLDVGRRSSIF